MKKKIFFVSFCFFLAIVNMAPFIFGRQHPNMQKSPINQNFMEYQKQQSQINTKNFHFQTSRKRIVSKSHTDYIDNLGLIPDPLNVEKFKSEQATQIIQVGPYSSSDIRYDMRDPDNNDDISDSRLTPVRNQGSCGSCWAFATYGTIESYLKSKYAFNDDENDLSEDHLKFFHGFDISPCSGGNMKMSAAYLFRNIGPVAESNFSEATENNTNYLPVRYIDNVTFMPVRSNSQDLLYIKNAILEFGALYTSIFFNEPLYYNNYDHTYYYDDPEDSFDDSNHAVVIVGWDDGIQVSNAPGEGAFIVRNSMGKEWGDNGYFYVSYYDESIARTQLGYFYDENDQNFAFDIIYQHDPLGWTGGIGSGDKIDWGANVFTASEDCAITAIGFYATSANMSYDLQIYQQFDHSDGYAQPLHPLMDSTLTGMFKYSGYYIIELDTPIYISQGKQFVPVIKFESPDNAFPVPIEAAIEYYSSEATSKPNESFVSDFGNDFYDLQSFVSNANICIKAYAIYLDKIPPIAHTQSFTIDEDDLIEMTLSGTSIRTRELSFILINFPENGQLLGAIPHLIYTPDSNFYGVDFFKFKINDGSYDSEPATISITVNPINDPPIANQLYLETQEDTALEFFGLGFDPDDDSLTLYIESPLLNGILAGHYPNYTYIPDSNFHGTDQFSFQLSDNVEQSKSVFAFFTVHPVNDPPEAFEQHLTLYQAESLAFTLTGSDPENDAIIFSIISGPKNGHLIGSCPDLIYQPEEHFWGEDDITFKLSDGEMESGIKRIQFTISPIYEHPTYKANSAPVAEDLMVIVDNDSTQILLLGNDPDDDLITFNLTSNPISGNLYGNPPNLFYSTTNRTIGFDSFTYTVSDGMKTSMPATVRLFIISNNIAPIANSLHIIATKNKPESITLSGTDPDNDPITFSIKSLPANGTISGNAPDFIYLPDENFTGTDQFTYTVNDGSKKSNIATVSIFIPSFNVNTDKPNIDLGVPVISSIADQETLEDVAANEIEFTISTSDPACSLTINMSSSNQTILPDKYIIYECNNNVYDLVATSALNQFGSVTITVLATDSSALTSSESFKLTITDVNDNLGYWINYQEAEVVQGQSDFTSRSQGLSISKYENPMGIAIDPISGKIFFADNGNNRVLRYSSTSAIISGSNAEAVLGQADFNSGEINRGGAVAANTMFKPVGLAFDQFGRLWVSDAYNNRVLAFDNAAEKSNGSDADKVLGQPDFTSNSSNTTQDGFDRPLGLYIDPEGHLWVAERYNDRVLRFDNVLSKSNGANADGVLGQFDFDNSYYGGLMDKFHFDNPYDVKGDNSGSIYVADRFNKRVLRYDAAALKPIGSDADGVLGNSSFYSKESSTTQSSTDVVNTVFLDTAGRLYVSDTFHHRILIFNDAANKTDGGLADVETNLIHLEVCF